MKLILFIVTISLFSNAYSGDYEDFAEVMNPFSEGLNKIIMGSEKVSSMKIMKLHRKLKKAYKSEKMKNILTKDRPWRKTPGKRFEGINEAGAEAMTFEQKEKWLATKGFKIFRGFKKELSILQIFKTTKGSDLFCLKQAIDNRESRKNMYKLLFYQIKDNLLRNLILFHFLYQAERNKFTRITVPVSDLDDTAYNSFKDGRFPKQGIIYPGYLKTMDAVINSNKITSKMKRRNCTPGIVFLTARDEGLGLTLYSVLTKRGIKAKKTILFGRFDKQMAIAFTEKPMARFKAKRAFAYSKVFPEKRLIMFGDNGQEDALAYETLGKTIGRKIAQVGYINNIYNKTYKNEKYDWDFKDHKLIRTLDSYPQMVLDMYDSGLIKDKKLVKETLLFQIKEINSLSTNKNYLRKDGMRDFQLEGIKLYCEKLHTTKKDICDDLPLD